MYCTILVALNEGKAKVGKFKKDLFNQCKNPLVWMETTFGSEL
jgi:hypothetical protein